MNNQENLLRTLIQEMVYLTLLEADTTSINVGTEAGTTKKVGKKTAEDLKGFLDVNRLSSQLKVPGDKLKLAIKDATKGKRKMPNDKVMADTMLSVLEKPRKEKDKVMNILKKVEISPEKQIDRIMKNIKDQEKKPGNVNVAL